MSKTIRMLVKSLQQSILHVARHWFFGHGLQRVLRPCFKFLVIGYCSLVWSSVQAASYPLPTADNNLIGEIQYVEVKHQETLLDIARQYDLGFTEIKDANPDVDPWLPNLGARIVVPTRFVLPIATRKGIVVNISEMRLYYFPKPSKGEPRRVITYPIGIGKQGLSTPPGEYNILMKIENPNWTMPLPVYNDLVKQGTAPARRLVPPGPDNPLGEFAMMLNKDGLFIHGTNKPFSIGMQVSRGCLRLYPEDIRRFVAMVPKGTSVSIVEQPYKFGFDNGVLFMEAHEPIIHNEKERNIDLSSVVAGAGMADFKELSAQEWQHIVGLAGSYTGVPVAISPSVTKQGVTKSQITQGLFTSQVRSQKPGYRPSYKLSM